MSVERNNTLVTRGSSDDDESLLSNPLILTGLGVLFTGVLALGGVYAFHQMSVEESETKAAQEAINTKSKPAKVEFTGALARDPSEVPERRQVSVTEPPEPVRSTPKPETVTAAPEVVAAKPETTVVAPEPSSDRTVTPERAVTVDRYAALRQQAQSGNAVAQHNLGVQLINDAGADRNVDEGVQWLTKAANNGHMDAQMLLASMYNYGTNVEVDNAKAATYYLMAGEAGNVDALFFAGNLYFEKQVEGVNMSERTLDKQAFDILMGAAKHGHADAQHKTGLIYASGSAYVNKSPENAFPWFEKSANQGVMGAQRDLGTAYYRGEGVGKDLENAAHWHRLAAEQGSPEAHQYLQREADQGIQIAIDWIRANGRVSVDET